MNGGDLGVMCTGHLIVQPESWDGNIRAFFIEDENFSLFPRYKNKIWREKGKKTNSNFQSRKEKITEEKKRVESRI